MRFLLTRTRRLAARSHRGDRGFMMVAILIGMGVAAIMMTAALPSWRQQVQRTREEELTFRGEQYARYSRSMRSRIARLPDGHRRPHLAALPAQEAGRTRSRARISSWSALVPSSRALRTRQLAARTHRLPAPDERARVADGDDGPARHQRRAQHEPCDVNQIYNQQQQHNLWAFDAVTYAQNIWQINLQQVANGGGQQGGRQGGGPGPQGGQQQGGGVGPRGGGPGRGGGDVGGAGPARGGAAPPPGGAGPGRGPGRGF
jgi:type II secretory pathway pseudopilin PulG